MSRCGDYQMYQKEELAMPTYQPPVPIGQTPQDRMAKKFDQDKIRYELLPPELLEEVSKVLTFGAEKYGQNNWAKGMAWGRVFGALMRHMWAWWKGEKADEETGYSHLSHAACCIAFLIAYEKRNIGEDDRWSDSST